MFCREERGSKEVKAGTWEECKRRNGPNARRREKPGPAPKILKKILKEYARSKRYKNAPERGASGGVAGGFVFCWILHRNLQETGRTAEPAKSGAFCLQKQEERKRHDIVPFSCFREKGLKKIAGGCGFYKYKSCGDRPFRKGAGSRRNRKSRSGILPVQNAAGQRGVGRRREAVSVLALLPNRTCHNPRSVGSGCSTVFAEGIRLGGKCVKQRVKRRYGKFVLIERKQTPALRKVGGVLCLFAARGLFERNQHAKFLHGNQFAGGVCARAGKYKIACGQYVRKSGAKFRLEEMRHRYVGTFAFSANQKHIKTFGELRQVAIHKTVQRRCSGTSSHNAQKWPRAACVGNGSASEGRGRCIFLSQESSDTFAFRQRKAAENPLCKACANAVGKPHGSVAFMQPEGNAQSPCRKTYGKRYIAALAEDQLRLHGFQNLKGLPIALKQSHRDGKVCPQFAPLQFGGGKRIKYGFMRYALQQRFVRRSAHVKQVEFGLGKLLHHSDVRQHVSSRASAAK